MGRFRARNRTTPQGSAGPRARRQFESRARRAAIIGGWVAALVGLVVLVGGWWLDIEFLRQPVASNVAMRAGTALGLLATGMGVVAAGLRWPRAVTGICAGLTTIIGAAACAAYLVRAPKTWLESVDWLGQSHLQSYP